MVHISCRAFSIILSHRQAFHSLALARRKTIISKSFLAYYLFLLLLWWRLTKREMYQSGWVCTCDYGCRWKGAPTEWISEANELKNNKQSKSLERALMCPLDDDMGDVASLSIFYELSSVFRSVCRSDDELCWWKNSRMSVHQSGGGESLNNFCVPLDGHGAIIINRAPCPKSLPLSGAKCDNNKIT